jgi:DNA mismatch repair protein MutS
VRALSILWPEGPPEPWPQPQVPEYFRDLNLDQIATGVAGMDTGADLIMSVLYDHVRDVHTVRYRQEVFRDLEDRELLAHLRRFAQTMGQVESHLVQLTKMPFRYQRAAWFLDASVLYCDAVRALAAVLDGASPTSRALAAFRAFVVPYASSEAFLTLVADTDALRSALAKIRYCVRIRGGRVEVTRYEGQADYSEEVLKTFERFKQGATNDYQVVYRTGPGMDHIGGQIVELVARLFHDEFTALDHFCEAHAAFADDTVRRFYAELRFYLAYQAYVEPLRDAGLSFCLPEVSATSKEVSASDTFDLALARKLVSERKPVVTNDFHLTGAERTFLVSGPNQGGKTTFARTFGQLHHLAGVGCPVPGRQASLFLFDHLFTHFEREEDLATGTGKLESDLTRMRAILAAATSDSVIILNETFTSSTMLKDARFLSRKVLEKAVQLDVLMVFVTFVDGLIDVSDSIVSMVSTIVPGNPAERTFKLVRGPAGGLAYALAVAEKHGLTYDQLRQRLAV